MTKIAIVGPGNVGAALGRRFAAAGYEVRFGVRANKDVSALLEECSGRATSASPAEAAEWADLVMLAVPGGVVMDAARGLGSLDGKILVDCNNPLTWDQGPVWAPPPEGSLAAALAAAHPGARVLKAFNTFGAEFHADPATAAGPVDVQIAGDDAAAKAGLTEICKTAGFSPIDCGPLRNASVLENLAMLWIHLAMVGGQGRDVAFKLIGRG